MWLQGLFLFCLIWTVGGTITGDSRKKFDIYFRTLISGTDPDHPKPKSVKITKVCCFVILLQQGYFNFYSVFTSSHLNCYSCLKRIICFKNNDFFQSNSFPERNTVYDFCFEKKASGSWIDWMDTLQKSNQGIAADANVCI